MKRTYRCLVIGGMALAFSSGGFAQKGRGHGNPHGPAAAAQGPDHPVGLERAREVGRGKKKGLDRAEQNQARHDARRNDQEQEKQRRKAFQEAQRADRERFQREAAQLPKDERHEREREFQRRQKEAYKEFQEQEKHARQQAKN